MVVRGEERAPTILESALQSQRISTVVLLIAASSRVLGLDHRHGARHVRAYDRRQSMDDDLVVGRASHAAAVGDVAGHDDRDDVALCGAGSSHLWLGGPSPTGLSVGPFHLRAGDRLHHRLGALQRGRDGGSATAQRMARHVSHMEPTRPVTGGVLLIVAGVYQVTPFKQACLRACQSPFGHLMRRWREGVGGAFRMGVEHGLHCLGCCWALMLLLFAGGVMNLAVIGSLTLFVILEKTGVLGRQGARISGAILVVSGLWMLRG
jgi:hypothetical protein